MLIRRATLLDGTVTDLRVGERIDEMDDGLVAERGEGVLYAGGGTVLPGLHDHHVHLRSAASALDSFFVGPPGVSTKNELTQLLSNATPGPDGWIRAVGYHESVAGDLDRTALDAMVRSVPVRIQHRSGALWILNSEALGRVGLAEHPDGRLRSADHGWSDLLQRRESDLAELSRRITATGVTGVTDATPDLDADDLVSLVVAHRRGEFRPRPSFLSPSKKILHDDRLDLDALTDWITGHHDAGRPVAVHCVTAAQLVVTVAALRAAGSHPQDRIEHAAVVPQENLADLADLGVTVVTQPNFVAERGDHYLADVPAAEHGQLWRVASLRECDGAGGAFHRHAVRPRRPLDGDARRRLPHHPQRHRAQRQRMCLCPRGFDDVPGWTGPAGPAAGRRGRTAGGPLCVERAAGVGAGRAGRRHGGGHHHRRRACLLRDVTGDHRAAASAARKLPH